MWVTVVVTSVLAWLQKFLGHLVPERIVNHPRIKRATLLLPVGLLAALIAVSTLTDGSQVSVDARLAGLAAAAIALLLRAPFLLVLAVAAAIAAAVRAVGG